MANINNGMHESGEKLSGSLDSSLGAGEQANRSDPLFEAKLDRLMRALDAKNPSDMMKILGLTLGSLGSAKKRRQLPAQWLVEAFEKHGISSDWILSGEGSMRRGEKPAVDEPGYECLDTEQYHLVPVLASWVTGGPQGELLYEGIADHYPFKRWWVERLVGKGAERKDALLMIRVRGESMVPTIGPGEVILVDTYEGERLDVRTGQIYLVKQPDGGVAVKRLALSERGDRYRLICMSDNPSQKPFDFELDPGRRIQDYVLGRVRWAGKEFD